MNFHDIKDQLHDALNTKNLHINEEWSLFPAFIEVRVLEQLTDKSTIGGPAVPMIMLIGESGQIYLFSVKKIIPDIW